MSPIPEGKFTLEDYMQTAREGFEEKGGRLLRALIYGHSGTGKTHLLKTCPRPIIVHSFDPSGTQTLKKEIEEGWIAPGNYEYDDPREPWAFKQWEKDMTVLLNSGIFRRVGTFAIDSFTMFSEAMMREALALDMRPNTVPQLVDYMRQQGTCKNWINILSQLPCHFICTAHIDIDKDEVSGRIETNPLASGKLRFQLPMLFSEYFVTMVKSTPQGPNWTLLTQPDGVYKVRTRTPAGTLAPNEEPDIRKLLKKAGYAYEDVETGPLEPEDKKFPMGTFIPPVPKKGK